MVGIVKNRDVFDEASNDGFTAVPTIRPSVAANLALVSNRSDGRREHNADTDARGDDREGEPRGQALANNAAISAVVGKCARRPPSIEMT